MYNVYAPITGRIVEVALNGDDTLRIVIEDSDLEAVAVNGLTSLYHTLKVKEAVEAGDYIGDGEGVIIGTVDESDGDASEDEREEAPSCSTACHCQHHVCCHIITMPCNLPHYPQVTPYWQPTVVFKSYDLSPKITCDTPSVVGTIATFGVPTHSVSTSTTIGTPTFGSNVTTSSTLGQGTKMFATNLTSLNK